MFFASLDSSLRTAEQTNPVTIKESENNQTLHRLIYHLLLFDYLMDTLSL